MYMLDKWNKRLHLLKNSLKWTQTLVLYSHQFGSKMYIAGFLELLN